MSGISSICLPPHSPIPHEHAAYSTNLKTPKSPFSQLFREVRSSSPGGLTCRLLGPDSALLLMWVGSPRGRRRRQPMDRGPKPAPSSVSTRLLGKVVFRIPHMEQVSNQLSILWHDGLTLGVHCATVANHSWQHEMGSQHAHLHGKRILGR